MKRIQLFIASFFLLFGIGTALLAPANAWADDPKTTVCDTLGGGSDCSTKPANSVDINSVVTAVVNILSWVVGVAAVIMIIISALRMVTANGDSNAISSARSGIIYALVGLVVVGAAQAIVWFVIKRVQS